MPEVLTKKQEEVLTGTLLGDACLFLPNKNGNPYLSIKRKPEDIEYLEWQASFFKDFTKRPVHKTTYISSKPDECGNLIKYKYTAIEYVSRCAKAFLPWYQKWYPQNKKIIPRDLKLSPIILAELFCDDGCVSIRKNGYSLKMDISIMGFCDKDIEFLKSLLESKYDEYFCISKNRVLYCSDAPTRLFLQDIDGYIPPGMERKTIWRNEKIDLFGKPIGKSRLKRQAEIKNKIQEFLTLNQSFLMIDLAKYTGCVYYHNGKLEPDYSTLKKYLSYFQVEKCGKYWVFCK